MPNQNLSRTISYKSTLDISDVINKIKQLEKTVADKHENVDLINVDNEIANLEKLRKKYSQIMEKGFSSRDDEKELNKLGSQIEQTLGRIDKAFDKVDYNIAKEVKNALKDALREARESLTTSKNLFASSFNSLFKDIKGKNEFSSIFKEAAREGRDFASVQQTILNNLDDQIKKAKESVSSVVGTTFSDYDNFKVNPFGNGLQLPTNIWNRVNGKNENNNYEAIKTIFLEIANSETKAEEKLIEFQERLQQVGVEFKKPETQAANFQKWFDKYTEKKQEYNENISELLDSKEYKTATNALEVLERRQSAVIANLSNDKLQNSYANWVKWSGAVDQAGKELADFDETQHHMNRGDLPQSFDNLTDAMARERAEVGSLVNAQSELDSTFNGLQTRLTQLLSIGTVYTELRQIIRSTYNDVKELDKAFGEIAMVTDYTVQDLWAQYGNYAKMANELGQSTTSVIQASGLFYQQGLDTASALTLTEDTMKLATLAGLDFADATSQMTAAIRAFKLEMDEGSHVTDVYAELAAHAAADVQGIATAMSKTASIANSAGMSFENTATFLTTMIEATQEAPDNIGTALKTVIARFTELKENVAGTADSAFDDLDYNKVDKALKSVGISLKDVNGQFRNLDEVFLELGQRWSTLDRNTQRYRYHFT